MKNWVLPTLVGAGVGAAVTYYFVARRWSEEVAMLKQARDHAEAVAADYQDRLVAQMQTTIPGATSPTPQNGTVNGLYGYGRHGFGAVVLPGEGQEFRHLYSQAASPGRRAMGLGAAYASIPGMAHFPGQSARAGYRNAMGY